MEGKITCREEKLQGHPTRISNGPSLSHAHDLYLLTQLMTWELMNWEYQ